jgi:hypothetical protein
LCHLYQGYMSYVGEEPDHRLDQVCEQPAKLPRVKRLYKIGRTYEPS